LEKEELRTVIIECVQYCLKQDQKSNPLIRPPDEILNIKEVSSLLNYKIATVYTKVRKGEIPVTKNGNRLRFFRHELEEWIKSGRKKTQKEISDSAEAFLSTRKKRIC